MVAEDQRASCGTSVLWNMARGARRSHPEPRPRGQGDARSCSIDRHWFPARPGSSGTPTGRAASPPVPGTPGAAPLSPWHWHSPDRFATRPCSPRWRSTRCFAAPGRVRRQCGRTPNSWRAFATTSLRCRRTGSRGRWRSDSACSHRPERVLRLRAGHRDHGARRAGNDVGAGAPPGVDHSMTSRNGLCTSARLQRPRSPRGLRTQSAVSVRAASPGFGDTVTTGDGQAGRRIQTCSRP